MAVLILMLLMAFGTLTYGPLAAILVKMFPTRIPYTSLSVPTTSASAGSGGFLPATAFAIIAATGNIYAGLWYPVIIASIALMVTVLFVKEPRTWISGRWIEDASYAEGPALSAHPAPLLPWSDPASASALR